MNWKEPIRLSKIKKADNKLHIEVVKINNGAHTYCMKEETRLDGPWEFGTKPVQRNSKQDWEEVKQHALTNQLEKIPADIYVNTIAISHRLQKIIWLLLREPLRESATGYGVRQVLERARQHSPG